MLNETNRSELAENGFTIIKGFYDIDREIIPIQKAIHNIIGLVIKKYNLPLHPPLFTSNSFDSCFNDMLAIDRSYGSIIYDAIKQIPAFLRLICSLRSEILFSQLRTTDMVGIGRGSYGIRIDHPQEDQFRSQWHQEFLFQPQSIDGVVIWTPLVPVKKDMGPVTICVNSHKDGLRKYKKGGQYSNKTGAYTIGLNNEDDVVSRYQQVAPLTNPGDLMIIDFLTIHQSGINLSNKSRWSIQSRFFNFRDPIGVRIGWKPSVTAGSDIESIFPEAFCEE
jgi:hypothetical protein